MVYFTYHVFIGRNDKYVSYFKKFRKQKFWKLFIWYILSYSMSIACLCITSRLYILNKIITEKNISLTKQGNGKPFPAEPLALTCDLKSKYEDSK